MPDTLSPTLSAVERKATADRLWWIVGMIDRGASQWELREAVTLTVREIEPFLAEYPKDQPMNVSNEEYYGR